MNHKSGDHVRLGSSLVPHSTRQTMDFTACAGLTYFKIVVTIAYIPVV